MADRLDGEVVKIKAVFVNGNQQVPAAPVAPAPKNIRGCCEDDQIQMLADPNDPDPYKNDISGIIHFTFPVITTAVVFTLQKWDNVAGGWVDKATLNNNNYGVFHPYKFFINKFGFAATWYEIQWRKVLQDPNLQEGSYRVRINTTGIIPLFNTVSYSDEFCVRLFTVLRANGTVRIRYVLNYQIGDNKFDYNKRDFGKINYRNDLRLPGWFRIVKSEYERQYSTRYNSGERPTYFDAQEPEFELFLKPIRMYIHEYIRTDVIQSDGCYITDYNGANYKNYTDKRVQCTSGWEPNWKIMQSMKGSVKTIWRLYTNNLRKHTC